MGEVRETSDICGILRDQWEEDKVSSGCGVREGLWVASSVRLLAWQAGCSLDLSIRTSSNHVPQVRGKSMIQLRF